MEALQTPMGLDEKDIVRRCLGGTPEAFASLYDAHFRLIYDFLYYRTLHRETAEDLTGQVFLRAFEKLATYDAGRGNFSAWLYGIARNALADHFRARRDLVDVDDVWDLKGDDDVEADAESRLAYEKLRPRLDALPKAQREIVPLRLWDGLSYAEIAALTGRTEAASKMAFSRAVARLREAMPPAALLLLLAFTSRHL